LKTIKPSFPVELWLEKPDVAEDRMNSDSADASSYATAGWLVTGGILATIAMNLAVKYGAGPFSGIINMAMTVFKKTESKGRKEENDAT